MAVPTFVAALENYNLDSYANFIISVLGLDGTQPIRTSLKGRPLAQILNDASRVTTVTEDPSLDEIRDEKGTLALIESVSKAEEICILSLPAFESVLKQFSKRERTDELIVEGKREFSACKGMMELTHFVERFHMSAVPEVLESQEKLKVEIEGSQIIDIHDEVQLPAPPLPVTGVAALPAFVVALENYDLDSYANFIISVLGLDGTQPIRTSLKGRPLAQILNDASRVTTVTEDPSLDEIRDEKGTLALIESVSKAGEICILSLPAFESVLKQFSKRERTDELIVEGKREFSVCKGMKELTNFGKSLHMSAAPKVLVPQEELKVEESKGTEIIENPARMQSPVVAKESAVTGKSPSSPTGTQVIRHVEEGKESSQAYFHTPSPGRIPADQPKTDKFNISPPMVDKLQYQRKKRDQVQAQLDQVEVSIRNSLRNLHTRLVGSLDLQAEKIGQVLSNKLTEAVKAKGQAVKQQVQKCTQPLFLQVQSMTQTTASTEKMTKELIQQYQSQVLNMSQEINTLNQGLVSELQKVQPGDQLTASLEQQLIELETKVNEFNPRNGHPMKVTLGLVVHESEYFYLLIVRWKTRKPEEAKCVQIVTRTGSATPNQVVLSEDLEMIPFECPVPNEIQMIEGDEYLLKQPFRITREDLQALQAVDWEFNSKVFNLEQQFALERFQTQGQITSSEVGQIKDWVGQEQGRLSESQF